MRRLTMLIAAAMISAQSYPEVPDDRLTPGAVTAADVGRVCARGATATYSRAHRRTPAALKE